MNSPVEVPRLSNTVEEYVTTRWMKYKRAPVANGELVGEVVSNATLPAGKGIF
jgi:hypothetical protein